MFGELRSEIPKIKHHRLRAAYWEQILGVQAYFKSELEKGLRDLEKRKQDSINQKRQQYLDRYSDPVKFIDELVRAYGHADPVRAYSPSDHSRNVDRLYKRGEEFIDQHLWRALKQYAQLGDQEGAAELVTNVHRAILKELPESAFRKHLQQRVTLLSERVARSAGRETGE
jgi:hypothetical protein